MLKALEQLIRQAGEIARSQALAAQVHVKGRSDFVTDADLAVSAFLEKELPKLAPGSRVLSEENAHDVDTRQGKVFIIDPIDGTTNFMCGYDHSAVSVGLLLDGTPIYGGIYDPYRDEYYSAVKGKGATRNGFPIRVSERPVTRGIVAIGSAPYRKDTLSETMLSMTADLFRTFADFRRSGSAALDICHVASGQLDAFCEPILSPWDYAAGSVILSEAGGISTSFTGEPLNLSAPSSCVFGSVISHPVALEVCKPYAPVTESIH